MTTPTNRPVVGERITHDRKLPDLDMIEQHWIPALESGQYVQGRGTLSMTMNDGVSYCCLGVLCDVMGARWNDPGGVSVTRSISMSGEDEKMRVHHTLPPAFAKRHGFYAGASVCLPPGTRAVDVMPPEEHYLFALDAHPSAIGLDGMNDRGRTFSQIAATLRKIVAAWRTYLDELYPLPATTTENTAER